MARAPRQGARAVPVRGVAAPLAAGRSRWSGPTNDLGSWTLADLARLALAAPSGPTPAAAGRPAPAAAKGQARAAAGCNAPAATGRSAPADLGRRGLASWGGPGLADAAPGWDRGSHWSRRRRVLVPPWTGRTTGRHGQVRPWPAITRMASCARLEPF